MANLANRVWPGQGRLSLTHEHHRPDRPGIPVEEPEGVSDRGGVVDRPSGPGDVRGDAGTDAGFEADPTGNDISDDKQRLGPEPELVDRVASIVLARIEQHQHIHLPEQAPDAAALEELKQRAPEAYDLWIETARKRVDHDIWRSQRATRQPYRLASLGQWLGLAAVLGVMVLAGYVAHEGHGVVAGVLGVIDIIGLAAVFNGNQGRHRKTSSAQ